MYCEHTQGVDALPCEVFSNRNEERLLRFNIHTRLLSRSSSRHYGIFSNKTQRILFAFFCRDSETFSPPACTTIICTKKYVCFCNMTPTSLHTHTHIYTYTLSQHVDIPVHTSRLACCTYRSLMMRCSCTSTRRTVYGHPTSHIQTHTHRFTQKIKHPRIHIHTQHMYTKKSPHPSLLPTHTHIHTHTHTCAHNAHTRA
jgi:hypothetical protein